MSDEKNKQAHENWIKGIDPRLEVMSAVPLVLSTPVQLLAENRITDKKYLFVRNIQDLVEGMTMEPVPLDGWKIELTGMIRAFRVIIRAEDLLAMEQPMAIDLRFILAVIKIKGNVTNLTPVEFGDSGRLRLGDIVLAIGNPFGVGQTVTMGIVSAKGRSDLGIETYEDFIQTDAAINPGNSGGALINSEGKLVGINTAILSRSGGYQGIGFAIPSNMVSPIMDSLRKNGKVVRGWLGVAIQDVDQELADAMKLPSATGVLLSDVKPGTPAAKAGLARGDVVLKVDGKVVDTSGQFRNVIAASGAKHKVHLDFVRDGKAVASDVELGEMPEADTTVASTPGTAQGGALDGIVLENLNPQNRSNFEIDEAVKQGIVIVRLDPQSNAARAGLRPGDVVLEVNRVRVDSPQKFQELYSKSKSRVLLLINRHGSTTYLVVKS